MTRSTTDNQVVVLLVEQIPEVCSYPVVSSCGDILEKNFDWNTIHTVVLTKFNPTWFSIKMLMI